MLSSCDGVSSGEVMSGLERLQYREYKLCVDVSFWYEVEKKKLHEWRLTEPVVPITCFQSLCRLSAVDTVSLVALRGESLSHGTGDIVRTAEKAPVNSEPQSAGVDAGEGRAAQLQLSSAFLRGTMQNFNAIDHLYRLSRYEVLWKVIREELLLPFYALYERENCGAESGSIDKLPKVQEEANISPVALFTYADLKCHRFDYAVAFPVLDLGSPVYIKSCLKGGYRAAGSDSGLARLLTESAVDRVHAHLFERLRKYPYGGPNPFLVAYTDVFSGDQNADLDGSGMMFLPFTPGGIGVAVKRPVLVVMADTSSADTSPGWAARNVIGILRLLQPSISSFALYCVRQNNAAESVFFDCVCDPLSYSLKEAVEGESPARAVGWVECKKDKGRTRLHSVDLGAVMSPEKLAESSSRLNLDLMKWRMLPQLSLNQLAECKALLLGSGTLGCNVARQLLMWGVKNITLVDRGNVSFSNPVRQSLFELSDVINPRVEERNKAIAGAKALKRVLPTVNACGVPLTIHMPGHRIDKGLEDMARTEIEKLDELIRAHDVVFLLTDSREARWLPTVMATAHRKPVLNVALAFDTYVVMRHGLDLASGVEECGDSARLGCYFCSDVVAPQDSMTARTLDQQCTVTRPGLSAIASATAVELLAQLYNHPLGFACPPYVEDNRPRTQESDGDCDSLRSRAVCPLGRIPQQIRGNIAHHQVYTLHGYRYELCTACSDAIVHQYKENGSRFVVRCVNEPMYIEEVSGVKAFKESCIIDDCDGWDDDAAAE
uniref:Ubiquitin-like modifier-activating enzyme ATG7 n=1 Tax=Trypanosoma congolense (strain IL3000) TaxID=1068625 RepID=G0UXP7_TRYCI|nr:putative ubiquitin activating E1 enzyme [Trypanosoma congolense IL3000]